MEAFQLLHQGALTLAQIEHNGFQIDTGYLDKTKIEIENKLRELEAELRSDKVYAVWRKRFGSGLKLDARAQLGTVIFDLLGYKRIEVYESTDSEDDSHEGENAEKAFRHVDLPFIKNYFKYAKLKKLLGTNIKGIRSEVVDGLLHPSYNLHNVRTFRGACQLPNAQNIPNRNPETSSIIRRAFIPRKGRQLLEVDFSGIEVRVACCATKDPKLISDFTQDGGDAHRATASRLFCLSEDFLKKHKDWAKKSVRDWAKNRFVFPEFYGSVFFQCAPNLWEPVEEGKLLPNGKTILSHLEKKGITEGLGSKKSDWKTGRMETKPGTFMEHVRKVEEYFWNERYQVYTSWKRKWYNDYLNKGYFDTFTGFRISGVMSKNQVLNYPIQGPSFHLLLWSLIQVNKWLKKNKMKTLLIGQIHDSMILDVYPPELQDVLAKIKQVTTIDLANHWKWIIVPLEVEAEISAIDGNWYEKQKVNL